MSFADAIRVCLSKYVDFSGRARRSEYWWFAVFNMLANIAGTIVDSVVGTTPIVQGLISLALLLPALAVTVRRLHDTDRSGWLLLLGLIPLVGPIIVLVFLFQDGTAGGNRFGTNPKSVGVPA